MRAAFFASPVLAVASIFLSVTPVTAKPRPAAQKPTQTTPQPHPFQVEDIPKKRAFEFLETEQFLDDDRTDYKRRLLRMFGPKEFYSRAQLIAARNPALEPLTAAPPEKHKQKAPPGQNPRDTLTLEQVEEREKTLVLLKGPAAEAISQRRIARFETQDYYTAAQVRDAESREDAEPISEEAKEKLTAINRAREEGDTRIRLETNGRPRLLIRHDWRDVLYEEDPSQKGQSVGDLTGAKISYVRDQRAKTDTWAVHGAFIVPFAWDLDLDREILNKPTPGFALRQIAVAPSVTLDLVTTNGDPGTEQNTVLYRVGLYVNAFGRLGAKAPRDFPDSVEDARRRLHQAGPPVGFQLRAAGVQITDFNHEAELQAFEADFEPRWLAGPFSLGYRHVWLPKEPRRSDGADDSRLHSQLRVWLHAEGGDVQDTAGVWNVAPERFLRLGPVVEFQLEAPELIAGKPLSLTLLYSRFYTQEGPSEHEEYFNGTLTWTLFQDPEMNRKVTLNADYRKGGLNFTEEEVDQFTISLGILF